MKYYRSKITKKIVSEKLVRSLRDIYGKEQLEEKTKEILELVEDPTVEECLRNGSEGVAILRYRELNDQVSFEDAKEYIQNLRKELKIPYKTKKKKN